MTDNSQNQHTQNNHSTKQTTVTDSFLTKIDEYTEPLATVDPSNPIQNLGKLDTTLSKQPLIGLGEATHGSKEFFQIKHRLFRYLVTEGNARVFALEANFPETLAINRYILHGDGDPEAALDGIYFWTWNVDSVLNMIQWMRDFNVGRPDEDKIRFYGFDAQYTQGAVDEIERYFKTVDETFLSSISDELRAVADDGIPPNQDDAAQSRHQTGMELLPEIRSRLHEKGTKYCDITTKLDWEMTLQCVNIIEQAVTYRLAMYQRQALDITEELATRRCLQLRDKMMADNIKWIFEYENPDQMVLWGHDAHLNRTKNTSRRANVSIPSVGNHLAEWFGRDYYALGFAFGRGDFQAISQVPDSDEETYALQKQTVDRPFSDTIEANLDELGYDYCIMDIRTAVEENNAIKEWLSTPFKHFSVGSTYESGDAEEFISEYRYSKAFDGLCFVRNTERATPIE
ncbi:MAG: erythromycin esterase family protein [Halobacteriaceae archaeon]